MRIVDLIPLDGSIVFFRGGGVSEEREREGDEF